MSPVMGGVIWLARLGMHLRGERACAKPLSSLNALAADAGVVAVTRLHVRAKGRPAMEGVMSVLKGIGIGGDRWLRWRSVAVGGEIGGRRWRSVAASVAAVAIGGAIGGVGGIGVASLRWFLPPNHRFSATDATDRWRAATEPPGTTLFSHSATHATENH